MGLTAENWSRGAVCGLILALERLDYICELFDRESLKAAGNVGGRLCGVLEVVVGVSASGAWLATVIDDLPCASIYNTSTPPLGRAKRVRVRVLGRRAAPLGFG